MISVPPVNLATSKDASGTLSPHVTLTAVRGTTRSLLPARFNRCNRASVMIVFPVPCSLRSPAPPPSLRWSYRNSRAPFWSRLGSSYNSAHQSNGVFCFDDDSGTSTGFDDLGNFVILQPACMTIGFLDFKGKEETLAASKNIGEARLLKRTPPNFTPIPADLSLEQLTHTLLTTGLALLRHYASSIISASSMAPITAEHLRRKVLCSDRSISSEYLSTTP